MKETVLKIVKVLLKLLPVLIDLLDNAGDKVQACIDREREKKPIV